MYYRFKENLYLEYGTTHDPEMPWTTSFLSGSMLTDKFNEPLKFIVDNPANEPPLGIEGICVPAFSKALVDVFKNNGVDNWQLYDAILVNEITNQSWDDYYAVNILGIISCVDLDASQVTEIAKRPGGNENNSLYNIHKLVINPDKIQGALIFRLAEEPGTIVIHEKLVEALKSNPNPNGLKWGVSCLPIEESS